MSYHDAVQCAEDLWKRAKTKGHARQLVAADNDDDDDGFGGGAAKLDLVPVENLR